MNLPGSTALPAVPQVRRHTPVGRYETFRSCARWDFGFACAFCLIHEADLARGGVEGLAATTLEHLTPKSEPGKGRDDYQNCIYACRWCNRARGTQPLRRGVVKLLDPTQTAWASRFEIRDDALWARIGDLDAGYTADVYDLADPRKTRLRAVRRDQLARARSILDGAPPRLRALAARKAEPTVGAVIAALSDAVALAEKVLAGYPAIPNDAPLDCACAAQRALPAWFAAQCSPD